MKNILLLLWGSLIVILTVDTSSGGILEKKSDYSVCSAMPDFDLILAVDFSFDAKAIPGQLVTDNYQIVCSKTYCRSNDYSLQLSRTWDYREQVNYRNKAFENPDPGYKTKVSYCFLS